VRGRRAARQGRASVRRVVTAKLVGVVACAGLLGSVGACVLASSAAAEGATVTRSFTLPVISCPDTSQLCTPVHRLTSFVSRSSVRVAYSAGPAHCSNIALLLFVDGKYVTRTAFTSPKGTTSKTLPWPSDGKKHRLGYEAEGETGGCNPGVLNNWAGTIKVTYTR